MTDAGVHTGFTDVHPHHFILAQMSIVNDGTTGRHLNR